MPLTFFRRLKHTLDKILFITTLREVRNDFTVVHNRKLYQVGRSIRSKEVTVQERINGMILITHKEESLPFREITARPERAQKPASMHRQRKGHTPTVDHPWKRLNGQLFRSLLGQAKRPLVAAT